MLKNFKKVCAVTVAVASLCSANAVFANSWVQKGYDTSDNAISTSTYACVYQELDDYGVPTGNYKSGYQILTLGLDMPAFAQSVTWGNVFVDKTHTCAISNIGSFEWANHDLLAPHQCGNLEYERLILDGKPQERVRSTGAFANIEYKWENSFWEMAEPYKIYQKKFANLPGLGWYTDASYPMRYSGDNETVKVTQPQVGVDVSALPAGAFNATGIEYKFDKVVPKVYQRLLTGTTIPVTVVDTVTYPNNGLFQSGLVADAAWVKGGYEQDTLAVYEILGLDGYVMDGGVMNMGGTKVQKPYIYRYTGGYAKPSITYTNYRVDTTYYNPETRTAPVVATKVFDGKPSTIVVATGEIATLELSESLNNAKAEKSVQGCFVARVNDNGTVKVLRSAAVKKVDNVFMYLNYDASDIAWGFVLLSEVPVVANGYVW